MENKKKKSLRIELEEARSELVICNRNLESLTIRYTFVNSECSSLRDQLKVSEGILTAAKYALNLTQGTLRETFLDVILNRKIETDAALYMMRALSLQEGAAANCGVTNIEEGHSVKVRWVENFPSRDTGYVPLGLLARYSPKIRAIKNVREVTGCELDEAKAFVEGSIELKMTRDKLKTLQLVYGYASFSCREASSDGGSNG